VLPALQLAEQMGTIEETLLEEGGLMKADVLKGSKQEIVDHLGRIRGEVREAIVFEEESLPAPTPNGDSASWGD
jgi:hypothetical protein